jgi:hypothetical protein
VKQRAHQAACRTGSAKGPQDAPVHVLANHYEAQRGSNEMRYRDYGHRKLGADPGCKQWSENAANPEAGDRGYGSSQDASARKQERVVHC